ncbi:MAG: chemotaxis protein CheW, partial [Azonexus sp.]|nr:chemotaxis protein CheW [Azonexus sp.]
TSDGQVDDVLALSTFPLGDATQKAHEMQRRNSDENGPSRSRRLGNTTSGERIEIATFFIGQQWLGIPAAKVVEAIGTEELTPVFGGRNDLVAGVKMYRGNLISVLYLQRMLTPAAAIPDQARQIVVVRTQQKVCFGLLVDELGDIPEVALADIQPLGHLGSSSDALSVGVVNGMRRSNDRHGMLSVLDTDRLCHRIGCVCGNDETPRQISFSP